LALLVLRAPPRRRFGARGRPMAAVATGPAPGLPTWTDGHWSAPPGPDADWSPPPDRPPAGALTAGVESTGTVTAASTPGADRSPRTPGDPEPDVALGGGAAVGGRV